MNIRLGHALFACHAPLAFDAVCHCPRSFLALRHARRCRRADKKTQHRHSVCRRHGLWRSGHPESAVQNPHAESRSAAREGMRFTDAHSSAALCSPSRYALLTGSYHWRRLTDIVKPFGPPTFKPTDVTLPQMLKFGRLSHRLHRQMALGLGLGRDQDSRCQARPKARLLRRRVRLVETGSRRPDGSRLRLLLRQRPAEFSSLLSHRE